MDQGKKAKIPPYAVIDSRHQMMARVNIYVKLLEPHQREVVRNIIGQFADSLWPFKIELPVTIRNRKDSSADGFGWFIRDANGDNLAVGLSQDVARAMMNLMNQNHEETAPKKSADPNLVITYPVSYRESVIHSSSYVIEDADSQFICSVKNETMAKALVRHFKDVAHLVHQTVDSSSDTLGI